MLTLSVRDGVMGIDFEPSANDAIIGASATAFGFIVCLRESSLFVQLEIVDNIDIVF
jgi:hypothetical protein